MATLKVTNIKNESFAGDQLYLKSDGRLGIGTTSPSAKLHVSAGHINIDSGYSFQWGDSHERIEQSDGKIEFFTGNGQKMTLSSDDLGIGTITPTARLDVRRGDADGKIAEFHQNSGYGIDIGSSQADAYIASGYNQKFHFKSDAAGGAGQETRLVIDQNGRIWIGGTASPSGDTRYLNIISTALTEASISFSRSNSLGGNTCGQTIRLDTTGNLIFAVHNVGTKLTLKSDGNIEVAGNLKSNNLPGRNLIINGAMQIAQRSSSSTTIGYHTVDRFQIGYGGHDEVLTTSQHSLTSSDTGPWEEGFRKSFHVQNGNQTSGADAGDYSQIIYKPEGQDINRSGWNFTDPNSKITLSYWIKASVAQNYYGFIEAGGPTRIFGWETGALTANTWKKVTVTIPGYASLAIPDTNGAAFSIAFIPYYGTNYTAASGRDVGQWYTAYNYLPTNTSTWWTTNDSTFEITGVQLEVGSIATEFEHRSYGEELRRCQRYYYVHASGNNKPVCTSANYAAGSVFGMIQFPVEMRTDAALDKVTGTDYFRVYANGGNDLFDNVAQQATSSTGFILQCDTNLNVTSGQSSWVQTANASAKIAFKAEL